METDKVCPSSNFQVRYKFDCDQFYGRILDNCNVVSSVQGTSKGETEQIWNGLHPNEPYDFDMSSAFIQKSSGDGKYTQYDLLLAIKRQIPFFYQASNKTVFLLLQLQCRRSDLLSNGTA